MNYKEHSNEYINEVLHEGVEEDTISERVPINATQAGLFVKLLICEKKFNKFTQSNYNASDLIEKL